MGRDRGVALLGRNRERLCPLFPEGFLFLARVWVKLVKSDATVGIGWLVPIPLPQVGLEPG